MKYTKHLLSFLIIIASVFFYSFTQPPKPTFKVVGKALNNETFKKNGKLDKSEIFIKNISNHPIQIEWKNTKNTMPPNWDYSMCAYGRCHIGIPKTSSFKKMIAPGEEGFIILHVFPKGASGSALVEFELFDIKQPAFKKKIKFNLQAI